MGTFEVPDLPSLSRDLTADVCVIGAGIAGLSTAHLTWAMDDRIYNLESIHGEANTRLIVESHMAAVNRIEEIVRLEGIDCDFRRIDGYLFLGPDDKQEVLDKELAAAHRADANDVTKLHRAITADYGSGPRCAA